MILVICQKNNFFYLCILLKVKYGINITYLLLMMMLPMGSRYIIRNIGTVRKRYTSLLSEKFIKIKCFQLNQIINKNIIYIPLFFRSLQWKLVVPCYNYYEIKKLTYIRIYNSFNKTNMLLFIIVIAISKRINKFEIYHLSKHRCKYWLFHFEKERNFISYDSSILSYCVKYCDTYDIGIGQSKIV